MTYKIIYTDFTNNNKIAVDFIEADKIRTTELLVIFTLKPSIKYIIPIKAVIKIHTDSITHFEQMNRPYLIEHKLFIESLQNILQERFTDSTIAEIGELIKDKILIRRQPE